MELTISRKSWFLRFFLWAWGADPERLNICQLFWGTIFLPLCLFRPRGKKKTEVKVPSEKKTEVKVPSEPSFYESLIGGATFGGLMLVSIGAAVSISLQGWWLLGIISLGCAVFFFLMVLLMLAYLKDDREIIEWSQLSSPSTKQRLALAFARQGSRVADQLLEWTFNPAFEAVENLGYEVTGFWGLLVAYYHAAKHRFCPRVKVVDS